MLLQANGENEKIQSLVDNFPFRRRRKLRVKRNDELTNVDEVSPIKSKITKELYLCCYKQMAKMKKFKV